MKSNGELTYYNGPDSKSKYKIVNRHPEIKGDERMYRWYVNEIKDVSGKITWCSDEFFNECVKSRQRYANFLKT